MIKAGMKLHSRPQWEVEEGETHHYSVVIGFHEMVKMLEIFESMYLNAIIGLIEVRGVIRAWEIAAELWLEEEEKGEDPGPGGQPIVEDKNTLLYVSNSGNEYRILMLDKDAHGREQYQFYWPVNSRLRAAFEQLSEAAEHDVFGQTIQQAQLRAIAEGIQSTRW